ncbi:MAG: PIG-L deacetylase family protein [Candidatus Tectimicrobiota bacterium]
MIALQNLKMLPEDWERALAVVAHPDDLEYGAASAVARWTAQGKQVRYLLVTRGEAGIDSLPPAEVGPLREAEERESARLVGVQSVEFLGYPDGIVEYGLPLRRDLARVIRQQQPEILLTLSHHLTWPGQVLNMADHRWVALALLDAARDAGNRWIFPELLREGLAPWSGVRLVCLNGAPFPTHAVDVTASLVHGIASLSAHKTYLAHLTTPTDPDAFLRQQAEATGQRCGCQYAVSFEVISL